MSETALTPELEAIYQQFITELPEDIPVPELVPTHDMNDPRYLWGPGDLVLAWDRGIFAAYLVIVTSSKSEYNCYIEFIGPGYEGSCSWAMGKIGMFPSIAQSVVLYTLSKATV